MSMQIFIAGYVAIILDGVVKGKITKVKTAFCHHLGGILSQHGTVIDGVAFKYPVEMKEFIGTGPKIDMHSMLNAMALAEERSGALKLDLGRYLTLAIELKRCLDEGGYFLVSKKAAPN